MGKIPDGSLLRIAHQPEGFLCSLRLRFGGGSAGAISKEGSARDRAASARPGRSEREVAGPRVVLGYRAPALRVKWWNLRTGACMEMRDNQLAQGDRGWRATESTR